jgi:16S rRNA (guanine527-N7)-methyltransferase
MEIVFKYFPDLTEFQIAQYRRLEPLYREWNEMINVISRKDIDQLAERHVLHSLGIAKVIHLTAGTKVLDAGTGGGFPGIPLAILFPEVKFHLVDSIGKKIKVVKAVAEDLGLKNVTAEQARVEELKGSYDFIISRAVTSLPVFYNWVHHLISLKSKNKFANGILYLKGGDLAEEISALNNRCQIFSLSDFFIEPFFETKKVVYLSDFRQF